MESNYGTIENPNLEILTDILSLQLYEYEKYLGNRVTFGRQTKNKKIDIEHLHLTPNKPNTARSVVPVYVNGKIQNESLYSVLFCPGDGTGDAKTYSSNQLIIPKELQFETKPERVFPRKKNCCMEAFFPFFSIINDKLNPNMISLQELSLDEDRKNVIRLGYLGQDPYHKGMFSKKGFRLGPSINFTVGSRIDNSRFGDPHAIYKDKNDNSMDIVGFLAAEKTGSDIAKVLRQIPRVRTF